MKRQVVVQIQPDHVDVVRFDRGKCGKGRRIDVSLPSDGDAWPKALEQHAGAVAAAVEELGATGATATVLYRSPTQSVDLSSYRTAVGEATEAAVMECVDALPYSEDAVCEATVVGKDAGGKPQPIHVVAVAERDGVAAAVAGFLEQATLSYGAATPGDAATMARLVSTALRRKNAQTGWLYLGEHTSFFLVTENRTLVFARQIGIGLTALADSLTRPIRRPDMEPVTLDTTAARRILHEHGFADRDQVVHEAMSLRGSHVTPLMQPVLQRFIVELRQSVRFGLNEEQRNGLSISLRGPGSSVPGIERLVSQELDVPVEVDESYRVYRWDEPGSGGSELADAVADRRLLDGLGLMPRTVGTARHSLRLRRWLWTGAALAAAVVGFDAFRYQQVLADARREADAIETQASGREALQQTNARLASVINAMDNLNRTIQREVGVQPDYRALMQELSRRTPASIKLSVVRLNRADGRTLGQISGFAADQVTGRTELERFIQELRASPLLREVELGSVQLAKVESGRGERFSAGFECLDVPVTPVTTAAAAGKEGAP